MLASITPLGERSRRQQFGVTVASLVAGATLAGGAVGVLLACLGGLLPLTGAAFAALACLAALGIVLDLRIGGARLPTHLRQVDEGWLHRYRGWVYGLGFGFQLGLGVVTVITTSAVYLVLAAELLAPSPAAGAAIGAAFGLARGASVLLAAHLDSPRRLLGFHRRFRSLERPAFRAAVAAQAVVAVAAVALAA